MDRKPPLKTLEQQAEAGDGASACILGDYYRTGNGVAQDYRHWIGFGSTVKASMVSSSTTGKRPRWNWRAIVDSVNL